MVAWIKPLRLSICFLSSLLAAVSFRVAKMDIPWFVIITVFSITCSAMLQNDWRDRYHDFRKGRILAVRRRGLFFSSVLIFWIISCFLIFSATMKNGNMGSLLVAMAFASLVYSEVRQIPLASNALVALTFGSPALLPVAAGASESNVWLLFLLVVFIAFGREITTDVDDEKIDRGYKWTIPLAVGRRRAKIIAVVGFAAGLLIAAMVSLMTLSALPFMVIGATILMRDFYCRSARNWIDIGGIVILFVLCFSI